MNAFSSLPVVLADAALKTGLLLALAGAIVPLLRRASAALRHLVWSAAVAGALALPALSLLLPEWRVPGLPDWRPASLPAAVPAPAALAAVANLPTVDDSSDFVSYRTINLPPMRDPAPPPAPVPTPSDWRHWGGLLWLAGAALALVPLAAGNWQVARLTRRCEPVGDAGLLAILACTARELGLRRVVRLRAGPAVLMPLTWGAWRPALLLPADAAAWPAERARLVLLHELAHIKRWDWLTQACAYLACALYWFNPLAWLAARAMRREREQACDDLVLRAGAAPRAYAGELLALAAQLGGRGFVNWAAVPMARRSSLEARLRAILDHRRSRAAPTRALLLGTLALLALVAVPLAMLRAANSPATSVTQPRAGRPAEKFTTATLPLLPSDLVKLVGAADLPPEETAARLRAWLEREGVPFPDGAKTSFADGVLSVTNTQENQAKVFSALTMAGAIRQVRIEARLLEYPANLAIPDRWPERTPGPMDGNPMGQFKDVSSRSAPIVTVLSGRSAELRVGQQGRAAQATPGPAIREEEQFGVVMNVIATVEENDIRYALQLVVKELVGTDGDARRTATATKSVEVSSSGRVASGETARFDLGVPAPGRKRSLLLTITEMLPNGQPRPAPAAAAATPPSPPASPSSAPTTNPPFPAQSPDATSPAPPAPAQLPTSATPLVQSLPIGETREAALVPFTEQLVNLPHLDLDTGKHASITIFSCGLIIPWRREQGVDVDLTANPSAPGALPVLGYAEMTVAPVPAALWENPEREKVFFALANLPPAPPPSADLLFLPEERAAANRRTLDPARDQTNTYAFRTREGGIGVLQLAPDPAAPAGARLRWQLISAPAGQAAAPSPAALAQPAAAPAAAASASDSPRPAPPSPEN